MTVTNFLNFSRVTLRQRFDAWVRDAAETRVKRDIYRRTIRELSACSDRDLADMGIGRSEIATIARKHAQLD